MIAPQTLPLTTGQSAVAAIIRALFQRAGFAERTLSDRLHLDSLDAVDQPIFKTLRDRLRQDELLLALADLFLFGRSVDGAELAGAMSAAEQQALLASDLVRPWSGGVEKFWSPVRLVPVEVRLGEPVDLLIAGDRSDHPDGSPFRPFTDIVFPGHNPLTRQFLRLLPRRRPARVLELCAGTGVAAIAMAATGSGAVASDIAGRSVHFAQFNAWLNGQTVEAVCGDLYEPITGQFDCILAHPPYVPALSQTLTYRDGGETGDAIVRGTVAGLPKHLSAGGTFLLLCLGMDTAEGPFEQRIRHWLGPAEHDFDVVFAVDSMNPPELIATRLVDRAAGSAEDLERWRDLFDRLQVKEFVYGAVVVRKHANDRRRSPASRRVLMTQDTSAADFDWLFAWFDWLDAAGGVSRVLDLPLSLPADLQLDVIHSVGPTGFAPSSYFLENGGRPFKSRLATDAWVAALLAELDGKRSMREVFQDAQARGRVPADFSEELLEQLTCSLIERGCLRADLH